MFDNHYFTLFCNKLNKNIDVRFATPNGSTDNIKLDSTFCKKIIYTDGVFLFQFYFIRQDSYIS